MQMILGEPVLRCQNNAALFAGGDARRSPAKVGVAAQADFDKNSHIFFFADQIQLTAAHAEIARNNGQALLLQIGGSGGFACGACFLLARHRMRHMNEKPVVPVAVPVDVPVANPPSLSTSPSLTPALYVVATPIGNLGDITLRALETLRGVDLVACEDTRHAKRLLDHYGVRVPTLALHQHNENAAAEKLIRLLLEGKRIALISDAGTPGVSDPGARTVAAVRAAGCRIVPLPGASAAITALCASGVVDEHFLFVGFLPAKVGARRTAITALDSVNAALVFYEAPHRVLETVRDLAELLQPEREIIIARELTKLFEQIERLPLPQAFAWLEADANHQRGEFVLIISAPPVKNSSELEVETERVLTTLLAELPVKQAVKLATEITGQPKNALYARALALKSET